jgi:hypothetical protein
MKKIITIIALALATLTLSAKDVVKNPVTNKVLDKTAGVYSIKAPKGIIILGTEEMTREFLLSAAEAFSKEILHRTFKIGDDQFEVLKDDAGLYITKVGLGVMKIRQSDVLYFGGALGLKNLSKDIKEGWKYLKEKTKDLKDTLRSE